MWEMQCRDQLRTGGRNFGTRGLECKSRNSNLSQTFTSMLANFNKPHVTHTTPRVQRSTPVSSSLSLTIYIPWYRHLPRRGRFQVPANLQLFESVTRTRTLFLFILAFCLISIGCQDQLVPMSSYLAPYLVKDRMEKLWRSCSVMMATLW